MPQDRVKPIKVLFLALKKVFVLFSRVRSWLRSPQDTGQTSKLLRKLSTAKLHKLIFQRRPGHRVTNTLEPNSITIAMFTKFWRITSHPRCGRPGARNGFESGKKKWNCSANCQEGPKASRIQANCLIYLCCSYTCGKTKLAFEEGIKPTGKKS